MCIQNNRELLEVLDNNGEFLGRMVDRSTAHSQGIMHGACHVHICKVIDGELYVLLQRRSLNKDSFPGCLDISSAGHVVGGYDFSGTAVKELKEELGVNIDRSDLAMLFTQTVDWKWNFRGKDFIDREFNVVYLLTKHVESEDITIDNNELSEVVWMKADSVIDRLESGDPEYGMNREEFKRSMSIIKNNYLEILTKSQKPY